jgi:hypothetical protein
MANRKISDLTALTAPATGDLLPIVDISEAAAADKNKNITIGELFASIPLGTAAAPSIAFEGDNTGIYSPGADTIATVVNGAEAHRTDSSGRLLVGTATANTSGAKLQTSNGITFPATQVASADANTLDDYEEGTFTPVVRDAAAGNAAAGYAEQFGRYTKIGNIVNYSISFVNVNTTGLTGANQLFVTGLPFTSLNLSNHVQAASAAVNSATPTTGAISFSVTQNQSYGTLTNQVTTGQTAFLVSQATSSAFDLIVTGAYRVS